MSWIRRKLPAKVWKWRWVVPAVGGIKLVYEFFSWMGWWSVILAVPPALLSGLLALANPLGAITLILIATGPWFLLALIRFLWWRASFYRAQTTPTRSISGSPLRFVDRHQEYDDFSGDIGQLIELRAVVVNDSPKNETVRDVQMTLVRVRRIARPGEQVHGQPHLSQLPRRLVSDRDVERDDLPPKRELAFRLCHWITPEWPPHALSRFSLAPGSLGGEIPLDFGRYLLSVIASGLNTARADQNYLVDVTPTQIYRHLCTRKLN